MLRDLRFFLAKAISSFPRPSTFAAFRNKHKTDTKYNKWCQKSRDPNPNFNTPVHLGSEMGCCFCCDGAFDCANCGGEK